jgi:DNA-binding transcriptional LysR family regulator
MVRSTNSMGNAERCTIITNIFRDEVCSVEHLNGITAFLQAAEGGSFAAAGEALGLTASAASKAVAALERTLGVPLLVRSTRGVTTTAEGERFRKRCALGMAEIRAAKDDILQLRQRPRGTLRVLADESPARARIAAVLPEFLDRFPELSVEFRLFSSYPGLAERGADLAVVLGTPHIGAATSDGPAGDLVVRALALNPFVTCAAPRYLQQRGVPRTPEDLLGHSCIEHQRVEGWPSSPWSYANSLRQVTVQPAFRITFNDGPATVAAAMAGHGLVRLPYINVAPWLASGKLVAVLEDWHGEGAPINVLYPALARRLPKVRCFIDFLQSVFADLAPERVQRPAAFVAHQWPVRTSPQRLRRTTPS